MQVSDLALGAIWFLAFLFSTTVHEACHALVAWKLGDPTAYHGGQVSLNPWPHIKREPFGMILMPLLSYAYGRWMIGWASAPYDPQWASRYPRRAGAMALAGPCGNLALLALATVGIRIGRVTGAFSVPMRLGFDHLAAAPQGSTAAALAALLSVFFSLNLILFLFNLLPMPPLDGAGVLLLLLPAELGRRWQVVTRHPLLALVGVLVAWRIFPLVFGPVFGLALRLLY